MANDQIDRMTPEWSRRLAEVAQAPVWQSVEGIERKEKFIDAASHYASYDDLPPRLKATFDKALRQVRRGNSR